MTIGHLVLDRAASLGEQVCVVYILKYTMGVLCAPIFCLFFFLFINHYSGESYDVTIRICLQNRNSGMCTIQK